MALSRKEKNRIKAEMAEQLYREELSREKKKSSWGKTILKFFGWLIVIYIAMQALALYLFTEMAK